MTAPSATWRTPKDWAAAGTLFESDFDDYLSSPLMFLKDPTQDGVRAGTTTNTTSASFVDIAGVTKTITTNAARARMLFVGSVNLSVAATVGITLLVDGTSVGDATTGLQYITRGAGSNDPFCIVFHTVTLTAASHIFKAQWKTSAGTLTLQAGWHFEVIEQ